MPEPRASRGSAGPPRLPFRRIVAGVDESELAARAVTLAGALAGAASGELAVLHSLDLDGTAGDYLTQPSFARGVQEQVHRLLERLRPHVPAGVRPKEVVRLGRPGVEVVAYARLWRADLIVLGTHGRGRVRHLLMGSTASDIVRHAPCPVLLVGPDAVTPASIGARTAERELHWDVSPTSAPPVC